MPPRAAPPWLRIQSPGLWRRAAAVGSGRRRAVRPASLALCGLGEGIRHIGAGAEGALQPRREAGGGGAPGLDLGGVGCARASKAGE